VSLFLIIDILGTLSFSISGVLTAVKKRMDPFGIFIIAFVTAVGGGTLRDVLIDAPVFWMYDLRFMYVIAGATVLAIIFRKKLGYVRKSMFLFDTIGIALYTVIGVEKGINAGFSPLICIALGTLSACFGGVIRDILCTEIPIIFRKEIYATACISGASAYFILQYTSLPNNIVVFIAGGIVIAIRLFAVFFKLSLPTLYSKEEMKN
tara:strand:+ start:3541 stop:4161 length:621 start_codon:yes stop_codon:yes gene_type:complete